MTPAYSSWLQLCTPIPAFGHSYRLVSLPVQTTLSSQIDLGLWLKKEEAVAPVEKFIVVFSVHELSLGIHY